MRLHEGLVLRGTGLGGAAGFAALLAQLPTAIWFGAVGICLHSLLYLPPFAASLWGNSSSISRTEATGLGQASGHGCFLASITLGICCSASGFGPFRSLGLRFVRRGDGGLWPSALSRYFLNRKGARYPRITAPLLWDGRPDYNGKGADWVAGDFPGVSTCPELCTLDLRYIKHLSDGCVSCAQVSGCFEV